MSAEVVDPPRHARLGDDLPRLQTGLVRVDATAQRRQCSDGGRLTLAQRVARVWEGLHAAGVAECIICRGRMEWVEDSGSCSSCGTRLS